MSPDRRSSPRQARRDFEIIASWIKPGSRVLDLGCGDGTLLAYLAQNRKVDPQGIERNWETSLAALTKGIPVLSGAINHNLDLISKDSFDVIILSKTVQELEHPDEIIQKMLVKGKTAVISFLNYGYWFNRIFFLSRGRKPVNEAQPFGWHNSPDLRPLSIKDFESYCRKKNITILKKVFLKGDWNRGNRLLPNLLAGYALYHLEKNTQDKIPVN